MRKHPPSVFCSCRNGQAPVSTAPNETGPARTFMSASQINEPFRDLRRPTGRKRPKERKDDQGRNNRVVQIGPDGLAASAHFMGCAQDRGPHWGYRRRYLSNAVG